MACVLIRKRLRKLWRNVEVFKLFEVIDQRMILHLGSECILVGKTVFVITEEKVALIIEMQHERRDLMEE